MPNDETKELVEGARPFAHFLEMLDGGAFAWELSQELRELCAELSQTAADRGRAKGQLQVTFQLTMDGKNLVVVPKFATKKPPKEQARTYLWLSEGNNPVQFDPRQEKLRFGPRSVEARTVAEEQPRVREVE